MSKLAALKGQKSKSLTANNLSDALSGEGMPTKKARAKTNRIIPFATRISQEFDDDFRRVAFENKLKHAELMELALASYKKHSL